MYKWRGNIWIWSSGTISGSFALPIAKNKTKNIAMNTHRSDDLRFKCDGEESIAHGGKDEGQEGNPDASHSEDFPNLNLLVVFHIG